MLGTSEWSLCRISSSVGRVTMLSPANPSPAMPSIMNVRICVSARNKRAHHVQGAVSEAAATEEATNTRSRSGKTERF